MEVTQKTKNNLFRVWLDLEFPETKKDCDACAGFDPLNPRKVYELPRGNYCFEHIIGALASWVNGWELVKIE